MSRCAAGIQRLELTLRRVQPGAGGHHVHSVSWAWGGPAAPGSSGDPPEILAPSWHCVELLVGQGVAFTARVAPLLPTDRQQCAGEATLLLGGPGGGTPAARAWLKMETLGCYCSSALKPSRF